MSLVAILAVLGWCHVSHAGTGITGKEAAACASGRDGDVQLLQHQLELTSVLPAAEATAALLAAEPLKWLHIPKCGTSLLNALIHLPGVCPGVDGAYRVDAEVLGEHFESTFFSQCPQVCNSSKFVCDYSHHAGIGSTYEDWKGHFVTMLREPQQRILSAFYDPVWSHGASGISLLEYAEKQRGGMTCQIMRDGDMDPPPKECQELTEADAREAALRLRKGFAFVGITDEWELSVCLFHRVFGGDCRASDFEDNRPSLEEGSHSYNASELQNFSDPVDRILYGEARQIFFEKLLRYNVSRESCEPCFKRQAAVAKLNAVVWQGDEKGAAGRWAAPLAALGAALGALLPDS